PATLQPRSHPLSSFQSHTCLTPMLSFFLFNLSSPPDIAPLSLHDALPISFQPPIPVGPRNSSCALSDRPSAIRVLFDPLGLSDKDRKSTRLNSSHRTISYAVFCLKKKKKKKKNNTQSKL